MPKTSILRREVAMISSAIEDTWLGELVGSVHLMMQSPTAALRFMKNEAPKNGLGDREPKLRLHRQILDTETKPYPGNAATSTPRFTRRFTVFHRSSW
jgi:hypothetical protein